MKRRKLEPLIVETSLKMFIEKGFDKVSVVDICNACDITKPTFYKYATSKGDLLRFYYNRIPTEFQEDWDDVSRYDNAWECIKDVYKTFIEYFLSYGLSLCTQLYLQNISTEQDTFSLPEDFKQRLIALFQKALNNKDCLAQGEAEQLCEDATSMMIGYIGFWILNNGNMDIMDEFERALANLMLPAKP